MFRALFAGAALALLAGGASAQLLPKATALVCVDAGGAIRAPDCKAGSSRTEPAANACTCREGVRAEVSVCAEGSSPPAESAAVQDWRRMYLRNRHTLVGADYKGQWLCVPPHAADF